MVFGSLLLLWSLLQGVSQRLPDDTRQPAGAADLTGIYVQGEGGAQRPAIWHVPEAPDWVVTRATSLLLEASFQGLRDTGVHLQSPT